MLLIGFCYVVISALIAAVMNAVAFERKTTLAFSAIGTPIIAFIILRIFVGEPVEDLIGHIFLGILSLFSSGCSGGDCGPATMVIGLACVPVIWMLFANAAAGIAFLMTLRKSAE
jgi:hypothetical protein